MSDDTSSHVRVSHLYDELLLYNAPTPSFIILCLYSFGSYRVDKQHKTQIRTHTQQFDQLMWIVPSAERKVWTPWAPSHKLCVLVYKCLHQAAPIYLSELCRRAYSYRIIHRPEQWKNALSSVTAGPRTMDNEVSRTLAHHYGTHYHWQFATTRYHCLSSVHA